MLAGMRGLGKSLLALDLLACVSLGLPWLGRSAKKARVLSLSLEGFSGIPERLRGWESVHGQRIEDMVWVRDGLDLRKVADADRLADAAVEGGATVVLIDSVRAAGAGAEDTLDMGRFVKGLERVQEATGGLVLALHNSGWTGGRERGSTLLGDACDAILQLEGDPGGVRTLRHSKYRDGDMIEAPGLGFKFMAVPGTKSGVLVEAKPEDLEHGSLMVNLVAAVQEQPGLQTGEYALRLARPRETVSKKLAAMADAGIVENRGTRQAPRWFMV